MDNADKIGSGMMEYKDTHAEPGPRNGPGVSIKKNKDYPATNTSGAE